ncbi:hypothetical protein [Spirosoma foliorum]|uniref:Uncharacterized protein n=1 Tax=Spirosoma foliorum TaxID=2710596 RepID=A0A7G5H277_9BACT|nr:hypothetical protein [Spirosoma foliorum]QMW05219.1 hypothetical protein H3H32_10185 [Spirosoma foliorum]
MNEKECQRQNRSIGRFFTKHTLGVPQLKSATTYKVFTGGSVSAVSTNVNGIYTSGAYTSGTQSTSFTMSSVVMQVGGSVGP